MQCAASQRNENGSTSLLSRGDRLQQCDFFQHRHELPATNSSNSASKNYSRFKLQMNLNPSSPSEHTEVDLNPTE